jgi:hypothetical protein
VNSPKLSLCNFTATVVEASDLLSALDKATSKIIDALSNSDYVFLDVYVRFGSFHFHKTMGDNRFRFAGCKHLSINRMIKRGSTGYGRWQIVERLG